MSSRFSKIPSVGYTCYLRNRTQKSNQSVRSARDCNTRVYSTIRSTMKTLSCQSILLVLLSSRLAAAQFFPLPAEDRPIRATAPPQETIVTPEDVTTSPQEVVESIEPLIEDTDNFILSECPLNCLHETVCARGNQTTEGHSVDPVDGQPLEFHSAPNQDGWHCACPTGLTGLQCGQYYENCEDAKYKCYNKGKCIPGLVEKFGNDQLFCDCEAAIDEEDPSKKYKGKYCEVAVVDDIEKCDQNVVCAHGGTCITFPNPSDPCTCPDGFEGKHCEYVQGSVPACEMDCSSEGYCRLGIKDGVIDPMLQFCDCLPGHFGDHCEHEAERCGENYCYHGSECFEILLSDGSSEHLCDCAPGYTNETYYSGQFCQYPSNVFCTGQDDPNGRQFCTNGGSCPTQAHHACDCPLGFGGPRCDHKMSKTETSYAKCSLDCKNGGQCQKGSKDLKKEFGKYAEDVSHLWDETTRDMEHCVCSEGFFGIACDYAIEQCATGGHICLHGSTCVTDGNEIGCDCEAAEHNTAGLFCEFFATDECPQEPQDGDAHRGFCTNGGTCVVDTDS
jgi:hypothetical protein